MEKKWLVLRHIILNKVQSMRMVINCYLNVDEDELSMMMMMMVKHIKLYRLFKAIQT